MTPEQWKRVRAIFEAALDQPAEARVEFLHQACADDPELLQQALALMRAHDTDGEFMKQPARLEPGDLQELPEGTMLGPYRIVRTIGSGGMGIVYLAYDRELERQVALKALPAYLSASPDLRERLRREARAAANIKHSSIAIVHALREIDGHLFIDSEYVSGTTLRLLLKTGPLEPSRALAIALKIASALRRESGGLRHRPHRCAGRTAADERRRRHRHARLHAARAARRRSRRPAHRHLRLRHRVP
jgi:serine/threonine protein kinase